MFTNKNHLWTHQLYANFQTACVLRSALEQVFEDFFWSEDGVHEDPFHFVYIYYVSQLYKLYFWNNCKTLLCNVMVVLLYLLCALDLILNVVSILEMFPPSVFGVWQIGIRALVYSELSIPNPTWYITIKTMGRSALN